MPTLRAYQLEDLAAVIESHREHQAVLGRAPTGSGKACVLAAVADHYAQSGRVMVLVDVGKLVEQLAGTVEWFAPHQAIGVEMGNQSVANNWLNPPRIIIGTVQTQYAGAEGKERYREFDPREFSALLLDETETFLAPAAFNVVQWYASNPALRIFGTSATPFRTDGTPMAELFTHVAFDRDILWGVEDGWLVKPRQGFVRVSLDFSSLKVRRNDEGERDYSDAEIAERINNEQTLIELAKGIIHAAQHRKSIVACPDVATAKALTHYLEAERPGSAKTVFGEMRKEDSDAVMAAHKRSEFQFLVSVMMLTKGYDDPSVVCVFNCRKTRSKRLYQQLMGRATRPGKEIAGTLGELETPEQRRAAIANSSKPECVMFNMVGIDDEVADITVLDILGEKLSESILERAKRAMAEDAEAAEEQLEFDVDDAASRAEKEEAEEKRQAEERERKQRRRFEMRANVEVEYRDDLRGSGGGGYQRADLMPKHLNILSKAKVPDADVAKLSPDGAKELAAEIVRRWKLGLCSYKQGKLLMRHGFTREEIRGMSYESASAEIDAIAKNGWKRVAS